jgi:hypothetical protein
MLQLDYFLVATVLRDTEKRETGVDTMFSDVTT